MSTIIPVTGSFTEYAERFIDDSLAFTLGWAYWYLWVTVGFCYIHCAMSMNRDQASYLGPCQ